MLPKITETHNEPFAKFTDELIEFVAERAIAHELSVAEVLNGLLNAMVGGAHINGVPMVMLREAVQLMTEEYERRGDELVTPVPRPSSGEPS